MQFFNKKKLVIWGEETLYQTSKYFIQTYSRLTTYYIRRSKNKKKNLLIAEWTTFYCFAFCSCNSQTKGTELLDDRKIKLLLCVWFSNHLTFCLSKSFEMDRLSIADHGRQPWMDSGCRARMQGYISFCGGPGCCWIPFLFRQKQQGPFVPRKELYITSRSFFPSKTKRSCHLTESLSIQTK